MAMGALIMIAVYATCIMLASMVIGVGWQVARIVAILRAMRNNS